MPIRRSPLRTRRLTTRGAATRARIVDAAAELVYRYGVGCTSLDDIMAASGTSKSQLYHYFPDKEALIREVIDHQTQRVLTGQEPELHRLDSIRGLRRWRDAMVERTRATNGIGGCPIGSMASELADHSEDTRELLAHCFKKWESYFADGLRAMRDRGELTADASPDEVATAIMTAIQGGLLLAQTTRSTRPLELALDMAIGHVAAQRCEPSATAAHGPTPLEHPKQCRTEPEARARPGTTSDVGSCGTNTTTRAASLPAVARGGDHVS